MKKNLMRRHESTYGVRQGGLKVEQSGRENWHCLFSLLVPILLVAIGTDVNAFNVSRKDPTIPPAEWLAVQPGMGSKLQNAGGGASRVQVVVIGKSRRFALIDGSVIRTGDVVNDAVVSAIRSDKIVIDAEGKSLSVTPNVEKKAPARTAVRKKMVVIPEDVKSSTQTGSMR